MTPFEEVRDFVARLARKGARRVPADFHEDVQQELRGIWPAREAGKMTPREEACDLIERYIREVGRRLPRDLREDVQQELRSLLTEAAEERAAGGRAFDEALAVEVLRDFGEPKKVAARYSPQPDYLVGPELFPAFKIVVKFILVIAVIALLPLFVTSAVKGGWHVEEWLGPATLFKWVSTYTSVVFNNLGIAVLVFAILQRFQRPRGEQPKEWDPRTLLLLEDPDRISSVGLVVRIYFVFLFAILLNFFPNWLGILVVQGGNLRLYSLGELGVRLPVALLNLWWLCAVALDMSLLRLGRWTEATRWLEFGLGGANVAILAYILARGGVTGIGYRLASEMSVQNQELLNHGVTLLFGLVITIVLAESLVKLFRLLARRFA